MKRRSREIGPYEAGRTNWKKPRPATIAPYLIILLMLISIVYVRADTSKQIGWSGGRDALHQPFSRDSIWNLPLGASASYVWGGIRHATDRAFFADADILVLKPSAPATAVYENDDDWGAGTRCAVQGGALFTAPIPTGFVIPGNHQGSEDGDTPNAATAILASDGHTLIQTQPFARCTAGQSPTSHYVFGSEDLYGTGETGSHGGSGLSALGGTVRLGELIPGGEIPHALKLNMDAVNLYPGFEGFRWPAYKSDAGGAGYTGSIPAVRMGSLLALRSNFSIASLQTEPGKIVARAFAHYGGYVVDTAGWSVNDFVTERSPDGSVQDEFLTSWGYTLNAAPAQNAWANDLNSIFMNLWAVDSWDFTTWQTVSASSGSLGAGLGAPLVSWAADFNQPTVVTAASIVTIYPGVRFVLPAANVNINFDSIAPISFKSLKIESDLFTADGIGIGGFKSLPEIDLTVTEWSAAKIVLRSTVSLSSVVVFNLTAATSRYAFSADGVNKNVNQTGTRFSASWVSTSTGMHSFVWTRTVGAEGLQVFHLIIDWVSIGLFLLVLIALPIGAIYIKRKYGSER